MGFSSKIYRSVGYLYFIVKFWPCHQWSRVGLKIFHFNTFGPACKFLCLPVVTIIIISLLADMEPKPTTANQLAGFYSRWREESDWKLRQMEESPYCLVTNVKCNTEKKEATDDGCSLKKHPVHTGPMSFKAWGRIKQTTLLVSWFLHRSLLNSEGINCLIILNCCNFVSSADACLARVEFFFFNLDISSPC